MKTEQLQRPVAERLWQKRNESDFLILFAGQLEDLAILGTEDAKNFLLDQATGLINPIASAARHSAIRGLAVFDRDLALRAALACRKGEGSSEGRDWPALLVKVGGIEALPHLKTELFEAWDIIRLYAIGETLRAEEQIQVLREWLRDEDPRVREGACYAACAQAYEPQLEQSVIRCCLDAEEDVRTAAQAAFEHLWRDREVDRLVQRLHIEPCSGRRWALIDSALAIGYPGVRPGFGQISWFSKLVEGRPYYEVQYSIDRLRERRKKLIEKLAKESKKFRKETWRPGSKGNEMSAEKAYNRPAPSGVPPGSSRMPPLSGS